MHNRWYSGREGQVVPWGEQVGTENKSLKRSIPNIVMLSEMTDSGDKITVLSVRNMFVSETDIQIQMIMQKHESAV